MATLVCFHAHPDDEAISTGGTMARAAAEGHRVVLVVATNGDWGEVPDDLADGESLVDRRVAEAQRSAEILGVHRVVWLGYRDSGMNGWEQNAHGEAFLNAPVDEAAARLAAVLREEDATTLTVYDWHGNYGHPDHVQVHRVGHRAAQLARTAHLYEATMNRDHVARLMALAAETSAIEFDPDDTDDGLPFGMPESELTTAVDVSGFLDRKRAALASHASQITDTSFFLTMPPEAFTEAFGTEWFIHVGVPAGISERWLAGL